MNIVVLGSLNIDRYSLVERLPQPGETVLARRSFTRFGGKGANQAVAAARLGARVTMIGAVGADELGEEYRERLAAEAIDTRAITMEAPDISTGSATIAVDAAGENCIIVDPGANARVTPDDIRAAREQIAAARVLLVQLETPLATVVEAIQVAHAAGVAVVLNPSPWRDDLPWGELALHTVIVNETEVQAWLGQPRFPRELAVQRVVVTQGAGPTLGFSASEALEVHPPVIQVVDTVGAGDAFAGAYVVALAEGMGFPEALRFANAAGALATQKSGAQEALPDRAAVTALLAGTTTR
jgi:ribokinase